MSIPWQAADYSSDAPIKLATKPTIREEIKQQAIEVLSEALEKAKAGDVEVAIVIMKHADGRWSDERTATEDMANTVGRVYIMLQSWTNKYLATESIET